MNTAPFHSAINNPIYPGVIDIDPTELSSLKEKLTLIDVREPDEFVGELGHIPGSQLISLFELEDRFNEIPDQKAIVFICRSGNRSGQAAAFAKQQGLNNVYNMKGGMLLWNQLGFATEK